MDSPTYQQFLIDQKACPDGAAWVGDRTSEQSVAECPRADWVAWFVSVSGATRAQHVEMGKAILNNVMSRVTPVTQITDLLIAVGNWITSATPENAQAVTDSLTALREHIYSSAVNPETAPSADLIRYYSAAITLAELVEFDTHVVDRLGKIICILADTADPAAEQLLFADTLRALPFVQSLMV